MMAHGWNGDGTNGIIPACRHVFLSGNMVKN